MKTGLILILMLLSLGKVTGAAPPTLKVSSNKHYLERSDGTPFFYLGDTAWELFHRLDRPEADLYLSNRAAKGFTVIQAVVLAELDGLTVPNRYGDLPLQNNDPTKPVEGYFRHVDYIVRKAGEVGMHVGLLPTWGDKWNKKWGVGPEIFTPSNAEAYGLFLGRRYKNERIIWILGGDRSPEKEEHLAIIRAMAKGLRKGDGGRNLITFHPMGGQNSSQWFHQDEWLDFNMFQSGHAAASIPNYELTLKNYALDPMKPTLDGEPRYEDHPIDWKPANGWFDDWDVRQAAYWSLLAGACGHTYGNHNAWQFWQAERKPISSARTHWKRALDQPGSAQMGYARRLFESRPFQKLVPDQTVVTSAIPPGPDLIRAARAEDRSFALVYIPTGKPVSVRMNLFNGSKAIAHWFDPRTAQAARIGEYPTFATQNFTPPSSGRGNDWVLVLDSGALKFPAPGQRGISHR